MTIVPLSWRLPAMLSLLLVFLFHANSAIAYWTYEYLNVTQWQWQSCVVVDDWLYIDGGELYAVANGAVTLYYLGQTISVDLSQSWTNQTVPNYSFETQRPTTDAHWMKRPSLWYNPHNGQVYQWGGWPYVNNGSTQLWTFTAGKYGAVNWAQQTTPVTNNLDHTSRPIFGAAFVASDTVFYSLGGNIAETYSIPYVAVQGLLEYNFQSEAWSNSSSLSATPSGLSVGGSASYAAEFGKAGFLIFIGGIAPDSQIYDLDGTQLVDMSVITLYDIEKGTWYHQTATGTIPPPRQYFCLVGSSSKEGSFEIFVLGGSTNSTFDFSNADDDGYRSVFALSLPAFRWFQSPDSSQVRRADHSCQIIGKRQMLVIGGTQPSNPTNTSADDPWPNGLGIFDMTEFAWSALYDASAGPYEQPKTVRDYYTSSYQTPVWSDPALAGIFTFTPSSHPTSTPTSTSSPNPTTTFTSNPTPHPSHIGAIVGGAVGGVCGVLLVLVVAYFLLRRRRRRPHRQSEPTPATPEIIPTPTIANEKPTHELESPTHYPKAELSAEESSAAMRSAGVRRKPLPAELP